MENNPLVSIALLTYNHEHYIKDCILGILNQDYSNIELIILDDASKDNTVKVINSLQRKIKEKLFGFIFLENKVNCGNIPHNLNCMIRRTTGKYIKLLSGDDIMENNCISKLINALINNPECAIAYSNQYTVEGNYKIGDRVASSSKHYIHRKSGIERDGLFKKLMFGNCVTAPTVIIKKAVFDKMGLFDESIPYEDYEYWIRIAYNSGSFYYLNDCLIYYRRGDSSLTNYSSKEKNNKIKISMYAVGKTLKKYYFYLSKEEQIECKKMYYYKYLTICWKEKYWRGFLAILIQMKRNDINVFPFFEDLINRLLYF